MRLLSERFVAFLLSAFLAITAASPSLAYDDKTKANLEVARLLFEYDNSNEFVSYIVRDGGRVVVRFASNTPQELYAEIVRKLQGNPDIKDLVTRKDGPACDRF